LFSVSMIVQVFLLIFALSVWLCQGFCQFVSCQYDNASVSASCSLSVWLCKCFYWFVVPCQYDCARDSVNLSPLSM